MFNDKVVKLKVLNNSRLEKECYSESEVESLAKNSVKQPASIVSACDRLREFIHINDQL